MFFNKLVSIATVVTVIAGAVVATNTAQAEDYPNSTIKVIVPYGPGGATDIAARVMSSNIPSFLGQPTIVINKPGAGGSIAFADVLSSKPDGYTFMMVANGANILYPALNPSLPFEWSDLKYVARTQILPDLLVVSGSSEWTTFEEFTEELKANPGKYKFSTAGVGTSSHLGGAVILKELGLPLEHARAIHYESDAAALLALIQGEVDFMQSHLSVADSHLGSKTVRGLAMTTTERVKGHEIPTVSELGFPGMEFVGWRGVAVPPETPQDVVNKIEAAVKEMTASKAWVNMVTKLGDEPAYLGSEDFTAFQAQQFTTFRALFTELGLLKK